MRPLPCQRPVPRKQPSQGGLCHGCYPGCLSRSRGCSLGRCGRGLLGNPCLGLASGCLAFPFCAGFHLPCLGPVFRGLFLAGVLGFSVPGSALCNPVSRSKRLCSGFCTGLCADLTLGCLPGLGNASCALGPGYPCRCCANPDARPGRCSLLVLFFDRWLVLSLGLSLGLRRLPCRLGLHTLFPGPGHRGRSGCTHVSCRIGGSGIGQAREHGCPANVHDYLVGPAVEDLGCGLADKSSHLLLQPVEHVAAGPLQTQGQTALSCLRHYRGQPDLEVKVVHLGGESVEYFVPAVGHRVEGSLNFDSGSDASRGQPWRKKKVPCFELKGHREKARVQWTRSGEKVTICDRKVNWRRPEKRARRARSQS